MSSLFLLYLLFYWRKFSSARCAARISLCRSLTRCRAAFSFLSLLFRDGFWWYLFRLRSLSTPSFIMRFLRRETARSGFSLRLIFTVSIFCSWLVCVRLPCSCSFPFFSTRVLYHDLLSLSSGLLPPTAATREGMYLTQKSYSSVLFTAVLGGALVCVRYGVGGGELSSGGLRWRATRSNSHLSPLCTDITWFNLLLFYSLILNASCISLAIISWMSQYE